MPDIERQALSPFQRSELDGLIAAKDMIIEHLQNDKNNEELIHHNKLCDCAIEEIVFQVPKPPLRDILGKPLVSEPDTTLTLIDLYAPEYRDAVDTTFSQHIRELHIN